MAPGPLPNPQARRRNTPTVPSTTLPAGGRKGRPPKAPDAYNLQEAGQAWWKWAWGTPQAAAWSPGALYTIARRAQLEDDLHALGTFDPDSLNWLFASVGDDPDIEEILRKLGIVIGQLKRLAGGEVQIMKEMRELDSKLGLDPKSLADLRWKIADDAGATAPTVAPARPRRPGKAKQQGARRLRVVDPAEAG